MLCIKHSGAGKSKGKSLQVVALAVVFGFILCLRLLWLVYFFASDSTIFIPSLLWLNTFVHGWPHVPRLLQDFFLQVRIGQSFPSPAFHL